MTIPMTMSLPNAPPGGHADGRAGGWEDMRTGDLGKLCAATIAVITSGTAGRGLEILQPSPEPGGVDAEVCAAEALAGVDVEAGAGGG